MKKKKKKKKKEKFQERLNCNSDKRQLAGVGQIVFLLFNFQFHHEEL